MGRKKAVMAKIENSASRQAAYSKRKDGIVKKATELSVLCDTHVGLIMFGPDGGLTSFASKERIEDIFLRYMDRPDEQRSGSSTRSEEMQHLYQRLVHLKYEGEMLEKIATIEELEEKLNTLNQRKLAAQEKMRFYNPNVEMITSIQETKIYEQYLLNALQNVEQLKAKLLGDYNAPQIPDSVELPVVGTNDAADQEYMGPLGKRLRTMDSNHHEQSSISQGPHLSLSFLQAQNQFNSPIQRHTPNLHIN